MKRISFWLTLVIVNTALFAVPIPDPISWTDNNHATDDNWSDALNWNPNTVPNNQNDQAIFPVVTNSNSVVVDGNFTINSMVFSSSGTLNYNFTANGTNHVLFFESTSTSLLPFIDVQAGNQTFSAANNFLDIHALNDLTFNIDSGASFTESGNNYIQGDTGTENLTLTGSGQLNLTPAQLWNFNEVDSTDLNILLAGAASIGIVGPINTYNMHSGTLTNTFNSQIGTIGTFNVSGGTVNNRTTAAIHDITTINISGSAEVNNFVGGAIVINDNINVLGGVLNNDGNINRTNRFLVSGGIVNNHGKIFSTILEVSGSNFNNLAGGSVSGVASLLVDGGVFNNFDTASVSAITDLNISAGRFNNFFDATVANVATLRVTGGTLFNDDSISTGIGTFSITSGTYEIGVVDAADRGFIHSTAMQLGGNLRVDVLPGFSLFAGEEVLILDSSTPIAGRFATVTSNNPALDVRAIYDPNDVFLLFLPAFPEEFVFAELHEPLFASVDHINFRIERELVKLRQRFCSCSCPWNIFAGYIGSTGDFHRNHINLDYFSDGVWAGVDYRSRNWGLGASVNYERFSTDRHNNFHVDFVHGDIFGTYVPSCFPCLAFEAIVGFGHQWWDARRDVFTDGLMAAEASRSHTDADEWDILFGVEYAWGLGCNMMAVPFATIQYIDLHIDRFHERGVEFFSFGGNRHREESLRSVLGLRFLGNYCFCSTVITPEIDIGWEHEYFDNDNFVIAPLVAPGFGARFGGDRFVRDFLLFAADFTFEWCNKYGLEASYDLQWNSNFHNHTYYVGGNVRF